MAVYKKNCTPQTLREFICVVTALDIEMDGFLLWQCVLDKAACTFW